MFVIVGSAVMGLLRNISPFGTKNASIALFGGMSISRLRIMIIRTSLSACSKAELGLSP